MNKKIFIIIVVVALILATIMIHSHAAPIMTPDQQMKSVSFGKCQYVEFTNNGEHDYEHRGDCTNPEHKTK